MTFFNTYSKNTIYLKCIVLATLFFLVFSGITSATFIGTTGGSTTGGTTGGTPSTQNPVCGNGEVEVPYEECEVGTLGCTDKCEYAMPICDISLKTIPGLTMAATGTTRNMPSVDYAMPIFLGSTVKIETVSSMPDGVSGEPLIGRINFGDGYDAEWSENMTHLYNTSGLFNVRYSVFNPANRNLRKICFTEVKVVPKLCGDGVADVNVGEECNEPGLSCSGDEVCNTLTCKCQAVCELDDSDTTGNFYVSPFNFGDGYDTPTTGTISRPYQYVGSYTASYFVTNPGNPNLKAECSVPVEVVQNECGDGDNDGWEECGEPGISCSGNEICNPYSCMCANSCDEITYTLEEECDDGMYCDDGTACLYNAECAGIGGGLCLVRSGDGCSNVCEDEYCGDGVVDVDGPDNIAGNADDEQCDDGNTLNGDDCSNRCTFPTCGDGVLDTDGFDDVVGTDDDEYCDEGSYCDNGTNCTLNPGICPNGLAECRPRNSITCSQTCDNVERCGDGIVQTDRGEQCDKGNANSDSGPCDSECAWTYCGDNTPQYQNGIGYASGSDESQGFSEQCDERYCQDGTDCVTNAQCSAIGDGQCTFRTEFGVGCNSLCQIDPPVTVGTCNINTYFADNHDAFPSSLSVQGDLCALGVPVSIPVGTTLPDGSVTAAGVGYVPVSLNSGSLSVSVYNTGSAWYWSCSGSEENTTCQTMECGDGIVQYYPGDPNNSEQCDDGNQVAGDGCSDTCEIEKLLTPFDDQADPDNFFDDSCINNIEAQGKNGVLPLVHADEYLPIWWEVQTKDAMIDWSESTTNCGQMVDNGVMGSSMVCHFALTNGSGPVEYFDLPCYRGVDTKSGSPTYQIDLSNETVNPEFPEIADSRGNTMVINAMEEHGYTAGSQQMSKVLGLGLVDLKELFKSTSIDYGQYKLELQDVSFMYCAPNAYNMESKESSAYYKLYNFEWPQAGVAVDENPICTAKVSIAQPYLTQKGPTLQELSNAGLDRYYSFEYVQFSAEGTPLSNNASIISKIASTDEGKQWLFDGFIDEYTKKAIISEKASTLGITGSGWDANADLKKVPNDNIFFYKRKSDVEDTPQTLTINSTVISRLLDKFNVSNANEAFTFVVVDQAVTLNINDDLSGNGAFLVKGPISFDPISCDTSNTVEGIFITNTGFTASKIRNNQLGAQYERCSGGSLRVEGVLVGSGIDDAFAAKRRSLLSAWEDNSMLFEGSYAGQAGELFRTCYLPNLLEFKLPQTIPDGHAQPVSIKLEGDGYKYTPYTETLPVENICSVGSFDWGRERIQNCQNDGSCPGLKPQINFDAQGPTSEDFKDYALSRINYWILLYMVNDASLNPELDTYIYQPTAADDGDAVVGVTNIDGVQDIREVSYQDGSNNVPQQFIGAFILSGADDSIVVPDGYEPVDVRMSTVVSQKQTLYVYYPAFLQAKKRLLLQFADIRLNFEGFGQVVLDHSNVSSPVGGILGKFRELMGFMPYYFDGASYVQNMSGLLSLSDISFFSNSYSEYIDFARIDKKRQAMQGQNSGRATELFEGASVLIQLNAGKWNTLSPGLKAYLEETVVEK